MAGFTLTASASLLCPHGGQVQAVPSTTDVLATAPVLVQTDTTLVAGCAFTLPSGTPNPCVQVQWVVADSRCTARGTPTLSQGSTGLCIGANGAPQGTVLIASTQTRAEST